MQINSINFNSNSCPCPKPKNTNFGATPNALTKHFLFQLQKRNVDTAPIIKLMRNIYVDSNVSSRAFSDGRVIVDMYNKNGDMFARLINTNEGILADTGSLALKDPKLYDKKLHAAISKVGEERTHEQRILDDLMKPLAE